VSYECTEKPTQGVYAQPVERRVHCQYHGTGDHLRAHNLLGLKVIVGSNKGRIGPDSRQRPPGQHPMIK